MMFQLLLNAAFVYCDYFLFIFLFVEYFVAKYNDKPKKLYNLVKAHMLIVGTFTIYIVIACGAVLYQYQAIYWRKIVGIGVLTVLAFIFRYITIKRFDRLKTKFDVLRKLSL